MWPPRRTRTAPKPIEVARDRRPGHVDLLRREQLDELALRRDLTAIQDRGR